ARGGRADRRAYLARAKPLPRRARAALVQRVRALPSQGPRRARAARPGQALRGPGAFLGSEAGAEEGRGPARLARQLGLGGMVLLARGAADRPGRRGLFEHAGPAAAALGEAGAAAGVRRRGGAGTAAGAARPDGAM